MSAARGPTSSTCVTITPPGLVPRAGLGADAGGRRHHRARRLGPAPAPERRLGSAPRRRAATLMIGGRHLGSAVGSRRSRIARRARRSAGADLRRRAGLLSAVPSRLPAGALDGAGAFAKLTVTADAPAGGAVPPVAIEQFDLQPPGCRGARVRRGLAGARVQPADRPIVALDERARDAGGARRRPRRDAQDRRRVAAALLRRAVAPVGQRRRRDRGRARADARLRQRRADTGGAARQRRAAAST